MYLKSSLHIHTKEDASDGHAITYDVYELIDRAKELGFEVLALTGHRKFIYKEEHGEYARSKGIVLIPGIELALKFFFRQNHVLVLNCGQSVENIKSFTELGRYKKENPHVFVIAPHPSFSFLVSMGRKRLKKFIGVFDAIEHNWFYTVRMNRNKKVEKIASEHDLPFIATSDMHYLKYFDTDYLIINAPEKNSASVLGAIRSGNYINCTRPKRLRSLVRTFGFFYIKYLLKYPLKLYRLQKAKVALEE